ncbi:unnamed protein product [Eruca vesicaria subsp. sativa]|uniref:Uncharacterized protein n=1 Tax=Eruca vesicaria subsp. sativa TaxID=29727 RepID=A0ABC8JSS6_ERUVS|nr:unnamed protein product [Eruca vesicaria subsp. sativa]
MGFLITTLIFIVVGIIASLCVRICFARGPSTNLYVPLPSSSFASLHLGHYCHGLLLDDVGDCIHCTDESSDCPNPKRSRVASSTHSGLEESMRKRFNLKAKRRRWGEYEEEKRKGTTTHSL